MSNFGAVKGPAGEVWDEPAHNMACFDALPHSLKHELRYCNLEWSAAAVHSALPRFFDNPKPILERLRALEGRTGPPRPSPPVRRTASIRAMRRADMALRRLWQQRVQG